MTTITTRVDKGSPLTIQELDDNFVNLSTDIVALQANAQAQQESIAELQGSSNVALVNANVTAANARIATIDANLGTATTNITALSANAATQATAIDTLTANAATQATALAALTANAATQTGDITALQGNAATQQTTIDTHTGQIATLDANLGTATTTITTLTANAATQSGDITTLTANAATQSQAIADVTAELDSVETWANINLNLYTNSNAAAFLASMGANSVSTTANVAADRVTATTLVTTPEIESLTSLDLNSPEEINVNANLRVGDNNTATQISTHGTGDLILRTHNGNANQGNIRLYNGANGNIDVRPNGTGTINLRGAVNTTGNVTAAYLIGDGSKLSGITAGTTYSDTNVAAYLAGSITVGNIASTNGYFWANGTAYSTGSGGGGTFSGDLAGNVLYDSINERIFANAYPLSTGQTTIPNNQTSKLFLHNPVYTSGVLQQPPLANATPGGTGIVNTSSQTIGLISSANVGLQSGYGFGSQNRDTIGSTFGLTVTPVTANSMSANDRIRAALGSLDIVMSGQNWGLMTTSGQNQNVVSAINGAANFNGSGNLSSIVGGTYGSFITPSAGNNANIQYATGVLAFTNLLSTAGATAKANIVNARMIAGFVSGFSSNLTVQNAIGLHTYSGWAGSGAVGSASNPTTGRFAVLNEDQNTTIQTNGNVFLGNGTSGYGSTLFVNSRFANIASTATFTGTVNFTTAPTGVVGKANTAFAAGFGTAATITGLNLAATISNGNIAQIGPNTGSITYSATTTEIINGAQTVRSVTGNTMSGFQSITPTNAPLDNLGDTLVAIVTDTTNSIVYRITYVKTSLSSGGGSPFGGVTIERLI